MCRDASAPAPGLVRRARSALRPNRSLHLTWPAPALLEVRSSLTRAGQVSLLFGDRRRRRDSAVTTAGFFTTGFEDHASWHRSCVASKQLDWRSEPPPSGGNYLP